MAIERKLQLILEKGADGAGLDTDELELLLAQGPRSKAARIARKTADRLSRKAASGVAEVHAQIGMDASACPKNCEFCSFAACNGLRAAREEMPKDEVIAYARQYVESGVNLMSLMVTAAYDFDKFCEMGAAVREVVPRELPLMANCDDFSPAQALQLREAGFDAVYHVVHYGEGSITSIDPETRLATMLNAREAGLALSTCVEPLPADFDPALTASMMKMVQELEPTSSGAGMLVPVKGTAAGKQKFPGLGHWTFVTAAFRLSAGLEPRLVGNTFLCARAGANYGWAEVGTNPRDAAKRTDHSAISHGVSQSKAFFKLRGWKMLEGPSQGWQR